MIFRDIEALKTNLHYQLHLAQTELFYLQQAGSFFSDNEEYIDSVKSRIAEIRKALKMLKPKLTSTLFQKIILWFLKYWKPKK